MNNRVPLVVSLLALVVALLALTQRGEAGTARARAQRRHRAAQERCRDRRQGQEARAAEERLQERRAAGRTAGPAGPAGPPGPTDAYWVSVDGPIAVPVQATPETLATLEIPQAGNYAIVANAYFDSNGSGIATLTCVLDTSVGDADRLQLLAGNPTPAAFTVVQTYTAPGSVALRCAGRAAADAHAVRITAIRVGTLTESGSGGAP